MSSRKSPPGVLEVFKFFDELPGKFERNVLPGALVAGADVIKEQAKALVPVGPTSDENAELYGGYAGALRDSIRVELRVKNGRLSAVVRAGGKSETGADVYYAHLIEYGVGGHLLAAKTKGALTFGDVFRNAVDHPGMRAQPFMRPALDTHGNAAIAAAAAYVNNKLSTKGGLDTPDGSVKRKGA